ncbi:hypothetical protein EMIHUDRAFT_195682 [Emiliania huxleyi CCMP1516]|uniref:Uncharacterized protein n=2 Tax=Emiliania huxleyi TaxID=2903 RepID=A0A0D3JHW8_EMIH1|nr:hypothetical protein EMIHUDRAFT_195682 [Emiliania huxleyi CCMP1516]EOD23103.1 hypothetical protein EMIHUDRAFT_195682 [Emiliania huxleyi CCMP1516]|eukprot:XP_005775532.1 hypothetical protein EMIHUDRAFT_195682 [Emiliania huxleyi CCMP1516]
MPLATVHAIKLCWNTEERFTLRCPFCGEPTSPRMCSPMCIAKIVQLERGEAAEAAATLAAAAEAARDAGAFKLGMKWDMEAGAERQPSHLDANVEDVYSVIVPLSQRRLHVVSRQEPIVLGPGDALVFKANELCHGGDGLGQGEDMRPPGPLRVWELCLGTASAMAAPLWGVA